MSFNETIIEHNEQDNFGRLHPIFKLNGFIYSSEETMEQIKRMRCNIVSFEQVTDNHFFVTNNVRFIQDKTLLMLQKK